MTSIIAVFETSVVSKSFLPDRHSSALAAVCGMCCRYSAAVGTVRTLRMPLASLKPAMGGPSLDTRAKALPLASAVAHICAAPALSPSMPDKRTKACANHLSPMFWIFFFAGPGFGASKTQQLASSMAHAARRALEAVLSIAYTTERCFGCQS